jgi:hypothetical protein
VNGAHGIRAPPVQRAGADRKYHAAERKIEKAINRIAERSLAMPCLTPSMARRRRSGIGQTPGYGPGQPAGFAIPISADVAFW